MNRYTAGQIEGMLFVARKFIEIVAEELRVATPDGKRIELGRRTANARENLLDVSREIYAEHPQINPFLETEKVMAKLRAQLRRINSRKKRPRARW